MIAYIVHRLSRSDGSPWRVYTNDGFSYDLQICGPLQNYPVYGCNGTASICQLTDYYGDYYSLGLQDGKNEEAIVKTRLENAWEKQTLETYISL